MAATVTFMHLMSRIRLHACLALMLSALACTDPASDLGSDLVGGGQEPAIRSVMPTVFVSGSFADITGQAPRVLAGRVDDPLMGAVAVTGHMDFNTKYGGPTPQITGAALRLLRTYAYGDTTSHITLAVHDILDPWSPVGSKADTMLQLGTEVTTHTFLSSDTVVVIPLPASWVDVYADTLEHAEADSLFHGLALVPLAGEAVVGFVNTGTVLQVHSADDTTGLTYKQSLTTTSRLSEPSLPEHRTVLQDGSGPGVRIEFDLAAYASQPVNGAVFLVYADTLAVQEAPASFARPMIEELQMVAVRDESLPAVLLGRAKMSDEGVFAFSSSDMAVFFYGVLFGLDEYLRLELRVPVLENSVDALVLHGVDSAEFAPELRLIMGS